MTRTSTEAQRVAPHAAASDRLDLPLVFGGQWVRGELIDPDEPTGQAYVFMARRQKDGRAVALKVIRGSDEESLQRFEIEVSVMQRCEGFPNIVRHIDSGEELWNGRRVAWIVMELVDRPQNFIEHLRSRESAGDPVPVRTVLQHLRDLARALHLAHQAGVIHRDLKPQNVLVGSDGIPRLCDFGLAVPLRAEGSRVLSDPGRNAIVGTWQYMSPEHVADNPDTTISAASDIYAFGVLMYEALSGRRPFDVDLGTLPAEQARQTIRHAPPKPIRSRAPRVGRELAYVVHRCLEKRPEHRYESTAALANDLDDLLHGRPLRSRVPDASYLLHHHVRTRLVRHRRPLTAAALILAALVALFVFRPVIERATRLGEHYQVALQQIPFPSMVVPPVDDTRIIAYITDERDPADPQSRLIDGPLVDTLRPTDFDALAQLTGLSSLDEASPRTWRPCTGAALARLSEAGARVVINHFNYTTTTDPSNDQPLIDGIRALNAARIPYVQSLPEWTRSPFAVEVEGEAPGLDPTIASAAQITRMGNASGMPAPLGWYADLAVKPAGAPWIPSITLVALAAWHGFDASAPVQADAFRNTMELIAPAISTGQPRTNLRYRPTTVAANHIKDEPLGLPLNVPYATIQLVMPDDQAIASIIWNIDDVLRADPQTLLRSFEGKAVYLTQISIGPDGLLPNNDGRLLPACLMDVVSFATLVSETPMLRLASFRQLLIEVVAGVLAGLAIALLARRWSTRAMIVAGLIVAQVALTVVRYRLFGEMADPVLPTCSMLLSLVLTHLVLTPWRYSHEFLAVPGQP